jgi:putative phosphoesterase
MKIGILSDTHNDPNTTRAALDLFKAAGVTRLLHCGDVTTAGIVQLFAGWDVTFVLGNMDLNRQELNAVTRQLNIAPPIMQAELAVDGVPIAMTHGHRGLNRLINSGKYRYVLHGHTHIRRDEVINGTRVINPGALGGRQPETRSIAVLDPAADDLRFIEVPSEIDALYQPPE